MRNLLLGGAALVLIAGGAFAYSHYANREAPGSVTVTFDTDKRDENSVGPSPGFGPEALAAANMAEIPEGLVPANASAAAVSAGAGPALCKGQPPLPPLDGDGRLLNHFAYPETASGDMVAPPAGFGGGNCGLVHKDMLPSLKAMIAAATKDDAAIGKQMYGISCFRSVERQAGLFCRPDRIKERGYAGQAKWVAPPGYSEHATGLSIDFGVRSLKNCDVSPCFKDTRTGKWLAANAGKFGFEMSFPNGNAQGVSFEPWHFRYIGSERAKAAFATAKSSFP